MIQEANSRGLGLVVSDPQHQIRDEVPKQLALLLARHEMSLRWL